LTGLGAAADGAGVGVGVGACELVLGLTLRGGAVACLCALGAWWVGWRVSYHRGCPAPWPSFLLPTSPSSSPNCSSPRLLTSPPHLSFSTFSLFPDLNPCTTSLHLLTSARPSIAGEATLRKRRRIHHLHLACHIFCGHIRPEPWKPFVHSSHGLHAAAGHRFVPDPTPLAVTLLSRVLPTRFSFLPSEADLPIR